jgi:hypothetical protein
MDQQFDQEIAEIRQNDCERKASFSPATATIEKQCSDDDRKWRKSSIARNTYESHQERRIPGPLFLNRMGYVEIKVGYWKFLDKNSQSNNTDHDYGIKSQQTLIQ